mmetsp:Transcript_27535/g.69406  ORF Transcript_27535/g.69406 Transcript_27535/m.69406 type:complete len:203 (+) Transcript_27535:2762-3370(+)
MGTAAARNVDHHFTQWGQREACFPLPPHPLLPGGARDSGHLPDAVVAGGERVVLLHHALEPSAAGCLLGNGGVFHVVRAGRSAENAAARRERVRPRREEVDGQRITGSGGGRGRGNEGCNGGASRGPRRCQDRVSFPRCWCACAATALAIGHDTHGRTCASHGRADAPTRQVSGIYYTSLVLSVISKSCALAFCFCLGAHAA